LKTGVMKRLGLPEKLAADSGKKHHSEHEGTPFLAEFTGKSGFWRRGRGEKQKRSGEWKRCQKTPVYHTSIEKRCAGLGGFPARRETYQKRKSR